MSKINCDFKLKDLYAIKHALEGSIGCKNYICSVHKHNELYDQYTKDIEYEKKIVDDIVDIISKYKVTEQHYEL